MSKSRAQRLFSPHGRSDDYKHKLWTVGSVRVSPVSYLLIRESLLELAFYNISRISRTDAYQTTRIMGRVTSHPYIVDGHVHQFANDTSLCIMRARMILWDAELHFSECEADLLELTGLPPTSPSVYNPVEGLLWQYNY